MIQILVCDKVYVTPQMRRKKMLYKIYFILSVILVISLLAYYVYDEYDRQKSAEVSKEILANLKLEPMVSDEAEDNGVTVEDDVIVVVLDDNSEGEINVDDLIASEERRIQQSQESETVAIPQLYRSSDGKEYSTIAVITIPKLNISYPVLSDWNYEILKNATCKYDGPNPNRVGNFCIIGHNYRNSTFFSKLDSLEVMDIVKLQDMSGKIVEYVVYDKYVVEPEDFSCTDQNTNGKKELTLITCYNYGKQRTIVKATATT